MYVEDLIAYLEKLPKNTRIAVAYRACSDVGLMDEKDIDFFPDGSATTRYGYKQQFVVRNGQLMEYNAKDWSKDEVPKFVPVLVFPGN